MPRPQPEVTELRDASATTVRSVPQKILDWLFREEELSLGFSEWIQLLSATILISSRALLDEFFRLLACKIEQSFADATLSDVKKEMILYNALSYIAFTDPKEGATLTIRGVRYSIEKIQLTSGWVSAPYYAYGLKAVNDPNAQSIIIFPGTTFPTDSGFLAGLLADTRPHGVVGSQLYSRGQENLRRWISSECERTGTQVMCTGQSLGGAMSLLCHVNQPDKVDFFAINPPSLTTRERLIYERNASAEIPDDSRVLKVLSHVNDPVLGLGSTYLPVSTKICRHGIEQDHWFNAHAKTADCHPEAEEPINAQPKRNIVWKILKPILFVVVLLLHGLALLLRLGIELIRKIGESCNHAAPDIESSANDHQERDLLLSETPEEYLILHASAGRTSELIIEEASPRQERQDDIPTRGIDLPDSASGDYRVLLGEDAIVNEGIARSPFVFFQTIPHDPTLQSDVPTIMPAA